jgi:4-carboxymuconolactone decarboxylase
MTLPPNHEALSRRTSLDTQGDVKRVLGKLEQSGSDLTILRILANSDHVFRPFVLISGSLLRNAVLPDNVREVVILWMASLQGTPYEWAEHVPMAIEAGVSGEQITAIDELRADEAIFSADEMLAIEIAGDLLRGEGIATEKFSAAVHAWTQPGALDLILSVGFWGGMVPTIIGGLGLVRPDSMGRE